MTEGDLPLSPDDQQLLSMQPSHYTIYLKNLTQTISRNLDGFNEVITGKDTVWGGGRMAANNYANLRYVVP